MTEYELTDAIATYSANGGTFFATYLTVISGYLITAFVAGKRLSSLQTAILNTGFIIAALVCSYASFGALSTQVYYTVKLLSLAPDSPQLNRDWVVATLLALMLGGVFSALLFMWNIRHSKEV
jgi:hypothetical protein